MIDWDSLIYLIENNQERLKNVLHADEDDAIMMSKVALRRGKELDGKFDVLQHLRDGGEIVRKDMSARKHIKYYKLNKRGHQIIGYRHNGECDGDYTDVFFAYDDWQPYKEPEPELEDGQWYWCKFSQDEHERDFPARWNAGLNNFEDPNTCEYDCDPVEPCLDKQGRPIKAVKGV